MVGRHLALSWGSSPAIPPKTEQDAYTHCSVSDSQDIPAQTYGYVAQIAAYKQSWHGIELNCWGEIELTSWHELEVTTCVVQQSVYTEPPTRNYALRSPESSRSVSYVETDTESVSEEDDDQSSDDGRSCVADPRGFAFLDRPQKGEASFRAFQKISDADNASPNR